MTDNEYKVKYKQYMSQFEIGWDQIPVRIARCINCNGLTINPQDDLCACGNELYPVTRLMFPGSTYYPGSSGGDEDRTIPEGPINVVLDDVPYRYREIRETTVTLDDKKMLDEECIIQYFLIKKFYNLERTAFAFSLAEGTRKLIKEYKNIKKHLGFPCNLNTKDMCNLADKWLENGGEIKILIANDFSIIQNIRHIEVNNNCVALWPMRYSKTPEIIKNMEELSQY